jgi:hypothetical protein
VRAKATAEVLLAAIRAGGALVLALCLCVAGSDVASADDPWEFWPEAQLFVGLNQRTRIFLNAAYAKGKESDEASLDTAAYLDISFVPVGRRRRQAFKNMDWQRGRYFWARVGYDRVYKATEEDGKSVAEDRGILSLWGKFPLPGEVWLEGRARADLRWIGDEYSTRYRWRVEATREFVVLDHATFPTSTSSGVTTRATTAGRGRSTRRASKGR